MRLFKVHKGKKAHCSVCDPEGYKKHLLEKKKLKHKQQREESKA
jgi:hypothetical protein